MDLQGVCVPEVLLSGNHAEFQRWHDEQRLLKARLRRPNLLNKSSQKQ
jgi:tRNA (guanine37-N1)-methyltransferase